MRKSRGSTLVESAIVLLMFVVILLGVMDFAQILFFHHVLSERVRSSVRYAVVHPYDATAIQNFVAYDSPTVPPGGVGLFGLSPSMVQVNRYEAGTADDRVRVTISTYRMRFLSPWLAGTFTPGPFSAVMPLESGGAAN
jgi:Flp pilus assembly protein TadG